jgi:uroporphyrinogen decarboxylase
MSPTPTPEPDHLFLRACRRLPVARTPVWMMRQAGRYLPDYQRVRKTVTFLELCRNPDLACEVTIQPIDVIGFDAAILFSDILIPLPPMGVEVDFPDKGPKIGNPVRNRADVDRLVVPDPVQTMGYVAETVRRVVKQLDGRVPLIGFCGAPFTMMTYAVEGGGSKDYPHTRAMLFGDAPAAHALLEKFAKTCAAYLASQIAAGAQAVQIFDSWAGILSPGDFREFALRWARRTIELVRESAVFAASPVPIIYFVNGCAPYLADYATSGADVLGVDWRIDLGAARRGVGDGVAVQGNLDPGALFSTPAEIRARVADVLAQAGPVGHIFNLGHGVLPETNPEHVKVMVEAVRELSARP